MASNKEAIIDKNQLRKYLLNWVNEDDAFDIFQESAFTNTELARGWSNFEGFEEDKLLLVISSLFLSRNRPRLKNGIEIEDDLNEFVLLPNSTKQFNKYGILIEKEEIQQGNVDTSIELLKDNIHSLIVDEFAHGLEVKKEFVYSLVVLYSINRMMKIIKHYLFDTNQIPTNQINDRQWIKKLFENNNQQFEVNNQKPSEANKLKGYASIFDGIMAVIRNTSAHKPRNMTKKEYSESMFLVSFMFTEFEKIKVTLKNGKECSAIEIDKYGKKIDED